nr:NADH dehydrogenase subunit 6 [Nemalecium lighti]
MHLLTIIFIIFIVIIMIFTSNNIIHSVNWFILLIINIAILFLIIDYKFLALSIIIVHIGAIAILFLFAIMLLDLDTLIRFSKNFWSNTLLLLTTVLLIIVLDVRNTHNISYLENKWKIKNFNDIDLLAYNFYNINIDIFILITILLLIGLLGVLELQLKQSANE